MPNGWRWDAWEQVNPVGREPVSSPEEAAMVLRAFGRTVARMLIRSDAVRFTVTAYSVEFGHVIGRDQWEWNTIAKKYLPHGEPWCPAQLAQAA